MKKSILIIFSFLISLNVKSQSSVDYIFKADSLMKLKKYTESIEFFTKAIELDSLNESAYLGRGDAISNTKHKANAFEDYNKALEINPKSISAYEKKAKLKKVLGNPYGASSDLKQANNIKMELLFNHFDTLNIKINDNYETEHIFDIPNTSSSVLFSRANKWIAKYYNSAQDVIKLNDRESGNIIVKGNFTNVNGFSVRHTIEIKIKDNKSKINIHSLIFFTTSSNTEYSSKELIKLFNFWLFSNSRKIEFIQNLKFTLYTTIHNFRTEMLSSESEW
jgi:tetratricopeptide (TPR) repeat protein